MSTVFIPRTFRGIATEPSPEETGAFHCPRCGNRRHWIGIEYFADSPNAGTDEDDGPVSISQTFWTSLDGHTVDYDEAVATDNTAFEISSYDRIDCQACSFPFWLDPASELAVGYAALDVLLRDDLIRDLGPDEIGELLLATVAADCHTLPMLIEHLQDAGKRVRIPADLLSRFLEHPNRDVRHALVLHLSVLQPFIAGETLDRGQRKTLALG